MNPSPTRDRVVASWLALFRSHASSCQNILVHNFCAQRTETICERCLLNKASARSRKEVGVQTDKDTLILNLVSSITYSFHYVAQQAKLCFAGERLRARVDVYKLRYGDYFFYAKDDFRSPNWYLWCWVRFYFLCLKATGSSYLPRITTARLHRHHIRVDLRVERCVHGSVCGQRFSR